MKKATKYFCFLILVLTGACQENTESKLFELVPIEKSKITFSNTLQPSPDLNILDYLYYYNGGGVAIGDINNDDLPDVFFTGNQVQNKLYLNKGNFEFEDITAKAGLGGTADWSTGATMADVNGDGFLDIYVCAVSGINGLEGSNELFINSGKLTFSEQAAAYKLDFKNYSTQAAFFDYDQDGDLDMYLLNHAVHTDQSYGHSSKRKNRVEATGDKLLRNDQGTFVDVSDAAGIYGGITGYGLGICTADFNNDGYVDLYISNDFHEDDYYYINNRDGTFTESIKEKFGHISRFSMGSDAADINQDGYFDLVTLDMMPEAEAILKASVGEDNVDVHNLKANNLDFHHQYARNMLQISQQATFFTETALYSGISATDWSWSALFADYDHDGNQDLFISNGIPKRPNDLDYIKYFSNQEIQSQLKRSSNIDHEVLNQMPPGAHQNYLYQGTDNLQFINRSPDWLPQKKSISNGTAYADLDNDGDLDLVVNNIDESPFIYNNVQKNKNQHLKLKLMGADENPFAIGSKAIVYHEEKKQYKQLFTTKGFQSASEPLIHFGFAAATVVDSLVIIWPDQTSTTLLEVPLDTTLTIKKKNTEKNKISYRSQNESTILFNKTTQDFGIKYVHQENSFIDFKRESLMPYQLSDRMQAMVVGDINHDGKDDLFFGGSKNQKAEIYLQEEKGFSVQHDSTIQADVLNEDMDVLLEDFNANNFNDLLVVSGGGEFFRKSKPLVDRYYRNDGKGNFSKDDSFPAFFENGSIVKAADFDQDNDLDLFIGGRAVVNYFGKSPKSYLFENTGDGFKVIENADLLEIGMVTDATFSDYDADGDEDLIVVGEWMSPAFFKNQNGVFKRDQKITEKLNGLWQTIIPFDIDQDGDLDYALGNWGLNSKYKASTEFPLLMYHGDIDGNGTSETIVAIEKNSTYYSINDLDELGNQLTSLKKKFTSYRSFAGQPLEAIFNAKTLKNLNKLVVHKLASGYLKNEDGNFVFVSFQEQLQLAPITNMLVHDFSGNGLSDLLIAGNYLGVTPYHGRFDGFTGAVILDDGTVKSGVEVGIDLAQKQINQLAILKIRKKEYLIAMVHNGAVELYEIKLPEEN